VCLSGFHPYVNFVTVSVNLFSNSVTVIYVPYSVTNILNENYLMWSLVSERHVKQKKTEKLDTESFSRSRHLREINVKIALQIHLVKM
jgi:hypothetical protein